MSERRPAIRRRRAFSREVGGLAGDAAYLAIWQASTTIAQLVQIALITHTLGLRDYGRLALVTSTVVLISQFFDVNVGVATTTFGARKLPSEPLAARSVFRLSYLTDAGTGMVAFLVAVALAPVVGPRLIGKDGQLLLVLYALVCLSSTLDASSASIVRLLDKFRLFALSASLLELLRVILVAVALVTRPTLTAVVASLMLAAILSGLTQLWLASASFRRVADARLFSRGARMLPEERRAFLRTVWHTNVISYVRLAQVQLPTLLVGALGGATQVGAYKIGTAAGCIPAKLLDPAQMAVLPRISRLWTAGRFGEIRLLVRQVSCVSFAVTVVAFALLAGPLGEPVLRVLGGSSAASLGKNVLIVSALAFSLTAALFWNGAVLFAAGHARLMSRYYLLTGITQCVLLVPLVEALGALGAAIALLVSTVVGNLLTTVSALKRIYQADRAGASESLPRSDEVVLSGG